MAFDGTNIWVVNLMYNTVTKLRASDGAKLGSFFTDLSADAVAVHGPNVFVSHQAANSLSVLRASDGGYLGEVDLGGYPRGLLAVGSHLWVTGGGGSNTVSKLEYPFAMIRIPDTLVTFAVGETLTLAGVGIDGTGALPPSSLSWTVMMRNGSQRRAIFGPVTGNYVPFVAPPPDSLAAAANSDLEVQLTVTQGGRSMTATRSIEPRKAGVSVRDGAAGNRRRRQRLVPDRPPDCHHVGGLRPSGDGSSRGAGRS
jgi:hypothetical protein